MTTVLKALQDLEQRELSAKPGALSTASREEPRRSPVLVPALLAMACGALGVAGLIIARQGTRPAAPTAVSVATAPAPVVQAQPQEVPPRVKAPAAEEAPWGRVERRVAAAPAAPPAERPASPPAQAAAQAPKPLREVAQRPTRERAAEVEDETDEAAAPPIAPAPAVESVPARAESVPAASTGTARVEVISIVYSSDVARRTATLRINGGRPVVMHEGQSASGVDVQLILERSVYISNRGNVAEIGVDR